MRLIHVASLLFQQAEMLPIRMNTQGSQEMVLAAVASRLGRIAKRFVRDGAHLVMQGHRLKEPPFGGVLVRQKDEAPTQ